MKKDLTISAILTMFAAFCFATSAFAAPPMNENATSRIPEKAVSAVADIHAPANDDAGKPEDAGAPEDAGDIGSEVSERAKALHELDKPLSEAAKEVSGR